MLKVALICYHKNITTIYPKRWIEEFKNSILSQTNNQFDIFEMTYAGGNERIFENSHYYESSKMPTFVHTMNYLLDMVFSQGYDYALNTNVDDTYASNRVEEQLKFMESGYDLISSNFFLVENEKIVHTHSFEKADIQRELERGNNPVCHPVVAYSKNFWMGNRYEPEAVPTEDMELWKRAINNGYSFVILEDVLCYHRLHSESVCQSENR